MSEAIDLALLGRGEVEPNPRVGAIALQDGAIVGRGCHRYYGGAHAEVEALADAAARGARPDTLVVTLEPCSSRVGEGGKKTPPCIDAIVGARLRTVIVGMRDPDPRHAGRGLEALARSGVAVEEGVLAERCRAINAPFARWLTLDRPWTIAKWAMTLDGKTATETGNSRWISGPESRVKTHELRSRVDAVVVGYRTARIDDPELTVRHVAGKQPVRIVVDPLAELDDDSNLVATARKVPTWLLAGEEVDPLRAGHLTDLGVVVLHVPVRDGPRRLDLAEAWRELRRRGILRVLVEGGGGLVAELMAAGCIDQALCFVAPKAVGGRFAPTPMAGAGKASMEDAWRFSDLHWRSYGDDLAIGAFAV
jgi:diaminohydroxyphosphoribosylaminopyrimidine deaminase/5-amino-6-(5-phosphoribosylamino)uracil reductase